MYVSRLENILTSIAVSFSSASGFYGFLFFCANKLWLSLGIHFCEFSLQVTELKIHFHATYFARDTRVRSLIYIVNRFPRAEAKFPELNVSDEWSVCKTSGK